MSQNRHMGNAERIKDSGLEGDNPCGYTGLKDTDLGAQRLRSNTIQIFADRFPVSFAHDRDREGLGLPSPPVVDVDFPPGVMLETRRHTLPPRLSTDLPADTPLPSAGATRHGRGTFPVGHGNRYRPRYKLRWVLNEKGRLPGQLRKPTDLCFLDSNNLVVAESRNSRLQIFGHRRQVCVDRLVAPDLVHPTSICQSLDWYLMLVADLNQVHYFSLVGEQEETWPPDLGRHGAGEFFNITALGVDCADRLVIAEHRTESTVGIFSQDTGQPVRRCKLRGRGCLGKPAYIACDHRYGLTYVADSIKGCVHSFDKNGKHIGTFGSSTTTPGNHAGGGCGDRGLICPLGMHLNDSGELYVADKGSHAVSVYSIPGGTGGSGRASGWGPRLLHHALTEEDGLRDPVAIALSPRGSLAVAQHSMDFGTDSFAVKVYKRTLRR